MNLLLNATPATESLGDILPLGAILPFVVMLLAIAILPLATPGWYGPLRNKAIVAAAIGVPVVAYVIAVGGSTALEKVIATGEEYISFIIYLATLFTISGGIYISGDAAGSPRNNTIVLAIGSVLANFIGTTGAAMLLIRPLLRANHRRTNRKHVFIFLIFIVCNTGGLLTPLGDPPLFLGFLRGIDFTWTLRLWPAWLMVQAILLVSFFLVDSFYFRKEPPAEQKLEETIREPIRVKGIINIAFLVGVIATTMISGAFGVDKGGPIEWWMRDAVYVLLLLGSLYIGPKEPRALNRFQWTPMGEVAIVFAGIFASMIPALAILAARGDEFGVNQPWQFYWLSGGLSSFLDNAPTYLVFTSLAQGLLGLTNFPDLMSEVVNPAVGFAPAAFLAAVSVGSVFMGANSYIGNAPNFMVRSIAEEEEVPMPNFFAYMGWALVFLIPTFILVTFVFFL